MIDCGDQHYYSMPVDIWEWPLGKKQSIACNCGRHSTILERTQAEFWIADPSGRIDFGG